MNISLISSVCSFLAAIIWGILFCYRIHDHNYVVSIVYGLAAIVSLFVAIIYFIKYRKCK